MIIKSDSNFTTLHLVIHGRVQGVFFRDSMRREAINIGVNGWVRNTANDTVEAIVHGEKTAVDKMVKWAHHGPERAQVSQVEVETGSGVFHHFDILY